MRQRPQSSTCCPPDGGEGGVGKGGGARVLAGTRVVVGQHQREVAGTRAVAGAEGGAPAQQPGLSWPPRGARRRRPPLCLTLTRRSPSCRRWRVLRHLPHGREGGFRGRARGRELQGALQCERQAVCGVARGAVRSAALVPIEACVTSLGRGARTGCGGGGARVAVSCSWNWLALEVPLLLHCCRAHPGPGAWCEASARMHGQWAGGPQLERCAGECERAKRGGAPFCGARSWTNASAGPFFVWGGDHGGTKVKCSVDPWRSSQWGGFVATGTSPLSHSQLDQKVHTLSGAWFQPRSLVSTQEPGFKPGVWFHFFQREWLAKLKRRR